MGTDAAHTVARHRILAALQGRAGGFEKVVGMVDGMVGVLEGEQSADDKQDVWCLAEVDISDLATAVDEMRDGIASVTSEMDALKAGLVDLDASVAEATEQRKKEHEESLEEAASNQACVEQRKKEHEESL